MDTKLRTCTVNMHTIIEANQPRTFSCKRETPKPRSGSLRGCAIHVPRNEMRTRHYNTETSGFERCTSSKHEVLLLSSLDTSSWKRRSIHVWYVCGLWLVFSSMRGHKNWGAPSIGTVLGCLQLRLSLPPQHSARRRVAPDTCRACRLWRMQAQSCFQAKF